jgi:hypothetical protein
MTIRIIAPAEIYTPPPISRSLWLMVFTSFLMLLFSADFILDLSIELISFNLNSRVFASDEPAGFGAVVDKGSVEVAAFNERGSNVKDKHVIIKQIASFFMIL